ncbi:MAG: hypothetical protein DWP92_05295 [Armatimonadetes bacterium]|nr:MAG: hypothetical protein DWP92_05295 [Armatimonadota bacterium]
MGVSVPRDWQGSVMTVNGLIPGEEMGITLPHEHLIITHQGPLIDLVDPDIAVAEVQRFKSAGGSTLVEMTSIGIGRDPEALKAISAQSGVQVIMGTGFYKDAWLPAEVHAMSVEEMTRIMVGEIVDGVGDTGIRAGVIGEIGVSRPITATEEKVLVASARAQQETGTAVSVHFDLGTLEEHNYVLDLLEDEGADMTRVIVDHFVAAPQNVAHAVSIAERGCYIEFELWGMHVWPKVNEMMGIHHEAQVASLRWFVLNGIIDNILISQDVCNQILLFENGGFGYTHILENLVPAFKSHGITDQQLQSILVENPRRVFAFQSSAAPQ